MLGEGRVSRKDLRLATLNCGTATSVVGGGIGAIGGGVLGFFAGWYGAIVPYVYGVLHIVNHPISSNQYISGAFLGIMSYLMSQIGFTAAAFGFCIVGAGCGCAIGCFPGMSVLSGGCTIELSQFLFNYCLKPIGRGIFNCSESLFNSIKDCIPKTTLAIKSCCSKDSTNESNQTEQENKDVVIDMPDITEITETSSSMTQQYDNKEEVININETSSNPEAKVSDVNNKKTTSNKQKQESSMNCGIL